MLYVLAVCWLVKTVSCVDPLVQIENGLVRGVHSDDGSYSMFLGIPYARVNKDNPFGIALDPLPIDGVFEANNDSFVCPQREEINNPIVGTLDCLVAHVFVPNSASSTNKLPVLLYIHGGGFRKGFANRDALDPNFFMKHDAIVVSFNYRLGVYGFLYMNRTEAPGNNGLRDQIMAMKWVKRNIAAFGGDEDNITLFGQSAGSASVEFHLYSGYSEGLFSKAILQSGSMLCDWLIYEPDMDAPLKLASQMGYKARNNDEALEFLIKSNPIDVVTAVIDIDYDEKFKPIVETPLEGVQPMLPDIPSNLIKNASLYKVPVIIGHTSAERLDILNGDRPIVEIGVRFKNYYDFSPEIKLEAQQLVRHFYIGSKYISTSTANMVEYDTDYTYTFPVARSAYYQLSRNNQPVYRYMFDYSGGRNMLKYKLNITAEGACHADELGYLFDQIFNNKNISEKDQIMIDRMTTMWFNFAKYGDPTPEVSELLPTRWEPAVDMDSKVLIIDDELHMEFHPYHDRLAFWDAFFKLYGDNAKW